MAQLTALAVAQRRLDRPAIEAVQPKHFLFLIAPGEMHDPDHLVRRIGLDKEAARSIKGRRRIAWHPIAVTGQEIGGQLLGEDRVVERGLLAEEISTALQHASQGAGPYVPMRRIATQREGAGVNQRIAAQPIRGTPAEPLAIAFPGEGRAKQFRPLVMALIGTVDFDGYR